MDKKITISIPEELINKLEEETGKHQVSFDELVFRKLSQKVLDIDSKVNFFIEFTKDLLKTGVTQYLKGGRNLADFSKKMVEEYGEEIRPRLKELFTEITQNSKIDDKPIIEWIDKHKKNLNLDLKKIEGQIIDSKTGLDLAARHKVGDGAVIIEFNDNTQGETWYHELAYVICEIIKQDEPKFLKEFEADIEKLAPSNKSINEKFADAFTRIYTDPTAPRLRLTNILEKQFNDLPKSFELVRRTNQELGNPEYQRTKGQGLNFSNKHNKISDMKNIFKKALSIDLFKIFLIVFLGIFLYLYYQNVGIGRFQMSMGNIILDTKTGETYIMVYSGGNDHYFNQTPPIIK